MFSILIIAFIAIVLYMITQYYPQFADFLIITLLTFNMFFLLKSQGLLENISLPVKN
jgi:preprotein translocase subunit SecD